MMPRPAERNRYRCGRRQPARRRQGAAMLVVMLVLLMASATAMFAIHATSFEMRAAGYSRHAMQTQYVAESALTAAFTIVDAVGPAAILAAVADQNNRGHITQMQPYEPSLMPGKQNYRLYGEDIVSITTAGGAIGTVRPLERESLGGMRQAYEPNYFIDVNDHYVFAGSVAGHRTDGLGNLKYLTATYTARGRLRLADGDFTSTGDTRQYHESAADARGYARSGPFGL